MQENDYICSICQAHSDVLKCVKLDGKEANGKSVKSRTSHTVFSHREVLCGFGAVGFFFNPCEVWQKESAGLREASRETNVLIKNILLCFGTKSSQTDMFCRVNKLNVRKIE